MAVDPYHRQSNEAGRAQTKTLMMISNWKKPFDLLVYVKYFSASMGKLHIYTLALTRYYVVDTLSIQID